MKVLLVILEMSNKPLIIKLLLVIG